MTVTALVHGTVIAQDGTSRKAVLIENGCIVALVDEREVPPDATVYNLDGGMLLAGFIDVQANGGGGVQFDNAPTVATLRTMIAAHTHFGTTGLMPTLTSADYPTIAAAVAAVEQAMTDGLPGLLGLHIEGPFISPDKHGIHDPHHFRPLDAEGMRLLTSLRHGKMLVTLAPECVPPERIAELVRAGVIVSLGHSNADYDTAKRAIDAGARGFTHLYNAMSPLATRAPAMVGAALEDHRAWCGIIMDGHHVHPAALRIAYASKGQDRLMLVTDAHACVGSDVRQFFMQGKPVTVRNGVCIGLDGTIAGSCLDMAGAFCNCMRFLGVPPEAASRMASRNAADFLGLGSIGSIAAGMRADLVLLDGRLRAVRTWIAGVPHS
jgi:N-acetylglucosamine-6-phosphate deacetylase